MTSDRTVLKPEAMLGSTNRTVTNVAANTARSQPLLEGCAVRIPEGGHDVADPSAASA